MNENKYSAPNISYLRMRQQWFSAWYEPKISLIQIARNQPEVLSLKTNN
jgi:hypothetical protein